MSISDKEMHLHQRLPYLGLANVSTVHGVAGPGFLAGTHVVLTRSITPSPKPTRINLLELVFVLCMPLVGVVKKRPERI